MKLIPNSFFQSRREFRYLHLNNFYILFKDEIPDPKNPEQIQKALSSRLYLDHEAYGGYGEDRRNIWADTYMKKTGKFIHLGVDINMKVGTPVLAPFDCQIVDKFEDKDTEIGWGGRLILERNGKLLLLGHLDPASLTSKSSVSQGEQLGVIGTWPTNGNTFQHLHVQVIKGNDFSNLDGYGFKSDLQDNPNPFEVEF